MTWKYQDKKMDCEEMKKKIVLIVMAACFLSTAYSTVVFGGQISVVVKTVLASHGETYTDPKLAPLIRELQTVFGYSSYRLLGENRLTLDLNAPGRVSLPGNRDLRITPTGIAGNRVSLRLEISKDGSNVFQTDTAILNNGSITVGGPMHMGGYLLFNITNSF